MAKRKRRSPAEDPLWRDRGMFKVSKISLSISLALFEQHVQHSFDVSASFSLNDFYAEVVKNQRKFPINFDKRALTRTLHTYATVIQQKKKKLKSKKSKKISREKKKEI